MKPDLMKVTIALVSVAFLLSCQDQGTGVVESEGAGPQFAVNCAKKPNHPKCPDGGDVGGGVAGTVTLEHGMMTTMPLQLTGKYDETTVALSANNINGDIQLNFPLQTCTDFVGENGSSDADVEPEVKTYLESQLQVLAESEAFFLEIDKTGLTVGNSIESTAGRYLLAFEYDEIQIRFGWVGPATIKWVSTSPSGVDVFNFTGPILVAANGVGGRKGKKGRRAIACADGAADDANLVTVTVVPPV